MPRKGRKTIDLPASIVNKWKKVYKQNKEGLELLGIYAFSGFMARLLNELYQEGVVSEDLRKFLPP